MFLISENRPNNKYILKHTQREKSRNGGSERGRIYAEGGGEKSKVRERQRVREREYRE